MTLRFIGYLSDAARGATMTLGYDTSTKARALLSANVVGAGAK